MALDLSQVATQLMDTLGQRGTLSLVQISRTFDPVTSTSTQTETVTELSGVNISVPTELADGELIKLTDRMFVIDNQVEPTNKDKIEVDNKRYSIINIETVKHAGVVQIYKVVARG